MQRINFIFIFFSFNFALFGQQAPIVIDKDDALFPMAQQTQFKEDKTYLLDIAHIQNVTDFTPMSQEIYKLAGSNPRNIWVKFQMQNQTGKEIYLELSTAITDSIYLYSVNPNNEISTQRAGKYFDFKERLVQNNHQIFVLNGKKDGLNTYYMNMRSQFPVSIRVRMGTHSAFSEEYHSSDLLHGIFIGVVFVVILFNFLFFVTTRESFYIFYVGYAVFILGAVLRFDGYLFEFLHPNFPAFNTFGFYFHGLAGVFGIYFTRGFLKTKIYTPILDKGLLAFLSFYVLNLGLAAVGLYEWNILSVYIITFPFNLFLIFTGIQVYRSGYKIARFFVAGVLCLSVGVTIFSFYNVGILGSNVWTRNMMYIGITFESIMFFMAIVERFSVLRHEKHDVQQRMILSLQQNERLIKERNRLLEEHAESRAIELEIMQTQLTEYAQKLIRSNQELTDFAHIASHDLRAPIRNIGSFAQLLEKRINPQLDVRAKEYLDFIKTNVRQSTKLIEDLLNYSKIDKNIGEAQPVDLNNVLLLVNNNLQSFIAEKKAKIIAKELPILRGHTSLIVQLFQNLINNGLKYNQNEVPTVTISADWVGNDLVFKIADNGIGVLPQYQEQIFGMFRRLHSSAEYEGSGIGLAFCQRIVSTYGGRIWLESEEGKGATFFFTLPKAIKKEEKTATVLPTQTTAQPAVNIWEKNTEGVENLEPENLLDDYARPKSSPYPTNPQPAFYQHDGRQPVDNRVVPERYAPSNTENAARFVFTDLEKLRRETVEKRFADKQPPF
jgi:signal transduction histidine kinase